MLFIQYTGNNEWLCDLRLPKKRKEKENAWPILYTYQPLVPVWYMCLKTTFSRWKSVWKCVKYYLKTENGCLKIQTKYPLIILWFWLHVKIEIYINLYYFVVLVTRENRNIYLGSVWTQFILLKTKNWKHRNKIIFNCVNSTVRPIFNIFFWIKCVRVKGQATRFYAYIRPMAQSEDSR